MLKKVEESISMLEIGKNTLKLIQTELLEVQNAMTEIKNILDRINSGLETLLEENISEFEDTETKSIQNETHKEKLQKKKNEQGISEL